MDFLKRNNTALDKDLAGKNLNNTDVLIQNKMELKHLLESINSCYLLNFYDFQFPVLNSFTSRKILLKDKNTCKMYFLKEKPDYSTAEESLHLFSLFQSIVHEKLKLAPSIVKTKDNNFFFKKSDKYFFLTEFISGKEFSGSKEQYDNIARSLARIHKVGLSIMPDSLTRRTTHQENILLSTELRKRNFKDKSNASKIFNLLDKLNYENQLRGNLISGIIHGDPAPFNILFTEENEVKVFNDFDNCCFGFLLQDLAACILNFSSVYYYANTSCLNFPICDKLNLKIASDILKSYLNENPKLKSDLQELSSAIILSWTELMYLGLLRGDFEPNDIWAAKNFPQNIKNQILILLERANL